MKRIRLLFKAIFLVIFGILVLIGTAIIIGVLIIIFFVLRPHPSDKSLTQILTKHEQSFNALIQMCQIDTQLLRVTNTTTWLTKAAKEQGIHEPGISPERWSEYRTYLKEINIPDGIMCQGDSVTFLTSNKGFIGGGSEKSILYLQNEDDIARSMTLVDSLDSTAKIPQHQPFIKKIKDHWYLYYFYDR